MEGNKKRRQLVERWMDSISVAIGTSVKKKTLKDEVRDRIIPDKNLSVHSLRVNIELMMYNKESSVFMRFMIMETKCNSQI